MKKILEETIKNINNATYNNIINKINSSSDLNLLTIDFIENINIIDINKIEPILKIILAKIICFNGDINTTYTKELYNKLTGIENNNIILLDNFISLFDEQKKIRLQYLSLTYQFIKNFSNIFPILNFFLKKDKLLNDDIEKINRIITNNVYKYFQSFFDLNFNKYFFKRITDCSKEVTKNVNTKEMISRMLTLCKIIGLKTLHKLNIEIISVSDFWDYSYLDRVKYFRIFYNRSNSLFKLYYKYYEMLLDIDNKLLLLIKIDPLDYIDDLEDSSSSFILSDDSQNMTIFSNNDNLCAAFLINESDDNADTPYLNLTINESDDMKDTPFISFENINKEGTELCSQKTKEHSPTYQTVQNLENSDNSSEDSDDQIYDFFVKE